MDTSLEAGAVSVSTFGGQLPEGEQQCLFDFLWPCGITLDPTGGVYIIRGSEHNVDAVCISRVEPDGSASLFLSRDSRRDLDNHGSTHDNNHPYNNDIEGIALDAHGNLYVANTRRDSISKIAPDGAITWFTGSGTMGHADGPADQAMFDCPTGLAIGPHGNLYVADSGNHCIRKVTPDGTVSTFAGSGQAGTTNGPALEATFVLPTNMIFDPLGNMIVADPLARMIRKITADGLVSMLAGSKKYGNKGGAALEAMFGFPYDIASDELGNLYVADTLNHAIRMIARDGQVTTIAGLGESGYENGSEEHALFDQPTGIAYRDGSLYVTDKYNSAIRKVKLNRINHISANDLPPRHINYGADECEICHGTKQATDELVYCKEACGHSFHKACIDACKGKPTEGACPICRTCWGRRRPRTVPKPQGMIVEATPSGESPSVE